MKDPVVFYHEGGPLLDEDGKRLYEDDDPDEDLPGWYYWIDELEDLRGLHGPYDSCERAHEGLQYVADRIAAFRKDLN
jgi:hypothetical protein